MWRSGLLWIRHTFLFVLFGSQLYDDTTLQFRVFVAWRTNTPNTILLGISGTRVSYMKYMHVNCFHIHKPNVPVSRTLRPNPITLAKSRSRVHITLSKSYNSSIPHPPSPINQILSTTLTLCVFLLNPLCDHISVNPSKPKPYPHHSPS
jgi:hypothetical protein